MPKDISFDSKIEAVVGKPVELPDGKFVANAEMMRAGVDLHLTSPDGHTVIVKGYFSQDPAPDLVTADGARLTPHLVNSFLPPEHTGQYAASGQTANDASPAGKITEVAGEAHIIHADGTRVPATVNTMIYQGDVIETSKTGAVNIMFADNTTFAISESARMSVDQFVYDSEHHSGSSFFSMLQGVFVYTSGLIGKNDTGSVNIETPVGTIGIRGTVIAGQIMPAGQDSKITILDGAITVTNSAGTHDMSNSFDTVSISSYQNDPVSMGQMDAQSFSSTYHSISAVANDTFSHFNSVAPATAAPVAPDAQHENTAPVGTAPLNNGEIAPNGATPPHDAVPPAGTAPPNGMIAPDGVAPPLPPPTGSPSGMLMPQPVIAPVTGYHMLMPMTDGTMPVMGGNMPLTGGMMTTTSGTTVDPYFTTSYIAPASPPPSYVPPPSGTTNTSGTFNLHFNFSPLTGSSLKEFSDSGTLVGMINPSYAAGPVTYTVAVNGANNPLQIVPNNVTSGSYTTGSFNYATAFTVDSTGHLFVNNPLVLSHALNPNGLDLTITATDTYSTYTINQHVGISDFQSGITPRISSTNIFGTTGDDFLIMTGSANNNMFGTGGADVILGNSGNNSISVTDPSFKFIDGGAGNDKLTLGTISSTNFTLDFTASTTDRVKNIETIDLGLSSGSVGNHVKLDIKDVFNMTDAASNHTLNIVATSSANNSSVYVVTSGAADFHLASGTLGVSPVLSYTGTYNGSNVTLVITETATPSATGGVVVNQV